MLSIGICTDFINLPDVSRLGYDYVELPLAELAALTESEFQEFVAYAEDSGLRIGACRHMLPEDLPVTGPKVNATALHGYLSHALGRARRLGVKVVTLDGVRAAEGDYAFACRQLGNFLRLIQGHAKECSLTVALEPARKADGGLLSLVSEATLISGLLQLDNIAVSAHWGIMAMASEPPGTLRRSAPLLRHVHVENALTRRLPRSGDGEDYARLTRVLEDIGYTGGVSLCGEITETFARDAAAALDCIRSAAQA